MPRESTKDGRTRSGYLILAGICVAAIVIFNIHAVRDLSRDQLDVVAVLTDASGVRVGTPVRVAGVEAGRVVAISFLPAREAPEVALTLRLEGRTRTVLRADSDVRAIRLRAIGQPIVKLEAGSAGARPVESGDTLRTRARVDPMEMLARVRTLGPAVDSLLAAGRQVRTMAQARAPELDRVESGLAAVMEAAAALNGDLEGGSLARLLGPEGVFDAVARLRARLEEVSAALAPALARYAPGQGSDGPLAGSLDALSARVTAIQSDLDRLSASMAAGGGVLYRMPRDSALQVAVRGVQAQIDTLRQEALSIGMRMLIP